MKIRFAAVLYAAFTLAFALFAGTALAGGHDQGGGNDGHGNSAQHSQSGDQQTSQQDAQQQQTTTTSSGDNSTGVKPSSTTSHDTHEKASSDKTKQYGNGQTAGQIATKSGYGDATLHGPGNSQPHKVSCGGHEVDVHALKNKRCGAVESAKHGEEHHTPSTTPTATTPTPAPPAPQKVTLCHKTGSATNPYVEITVSVNALKHGHTTDKGDIIPAPASGCPTGQVLGTTTTPASSETGAQDCTTTRTESSQVVVGVKHFIGPKGSGRYVIIHPNPNSSHYRDKHPDELVYATVTKTVTEPKAGCSGSSTTKTTTTAGTEQAQTPTTATTVAAAAATQSATPATSSATSAPTAAAGGVLGATAPLNTAAKSKPAGGVLGTTVRLGRSVGSSTLPFTGLPLWIFALVAASLIGIGAVTRRAGAQR